MKSHGMSVMIAGLVLAGCTTAGAGDDLDMERMLSGKSAMQGKTLEKAIAKAEKYSLGSRENPVRVEMPPGQHAYLRRLRCSDGSAPRFGRDGNLGPGVYGNIIDSYTVDCGSAAPGMVHVIMDMYHAGHIEDRPVPGFTIVPR